MSFLAAWKKVSEAKGIECTEQKSVLIQRDKDQWGLLFAYRVWLTFVFRPNPPLHITLHYHRSLWIWVTEQPPIGSSLMSITDHYVSLDRLSWPPAAQGLNLTPHCTLHCITTIDACAWDLSDRAASYRVIINIHYWTDHSVSLDHQQHKS